MKNNLTKREKFLIKLLVFILVFYGSINYIIKPIADEYTTNKAMLPLLQGQKNQIQQQIDSTANLENDRDSVKDSLLQRDSYLIRTMENHYSDNMITALCLEYSLKPLKLSVETTVPRGDGENNMLKVATLSVDVLGDYTNLKNLVTTVNQMRYITVNSFSTSFNGSANIVFEVYMFDELGIR